MAAQPTDPTAEPTQTTWAARVEAITALAQLHAENARLLLRLQTNLVYLRQQLTALDENIADLTRTQGRLVDRLVRDGATEAQAWRQATVVEMEREIKHWEQRRAARLAAIEATARVVEK